MFTLDTLRWSHMARSPYCWWETRSVLILDETIIYRVIPYAGREHNSEESIGNKNDCVLYRNHIQRRVYRMTLCGIPIHGHGETEI